MIRLVRHSSRIIVACLAVALLLGQQVAADVDPDLLFCVHQGGFGGTCFQDPNGCLGGSAATTDSTTGSSNPNGPTIVLDPGHSGNDIHDTDPQTGLYDHDYPNVPEISEVFSVAQKVQSQLQKDGYNVVMTKSSVNDDVSFRQRADIANQANAALALSIHDSHDTSWSDMGGGDGGQVYTQNVDDYRQNKPGMGRGTQKVSFTDSSVAAKSNQYGAIFAQQRTADEHHTVAVVHDSFDGRAGLPSGNIPMVMLFSKVPWVYNEVGAPHGPLSSSELAEYATGITDGVEKSVPVGTPSSTSTSGSGSTCQCQTSGAGVGSVALRGSSNQEKIYNYFVDQGLTPVQAAAIDGNFGQESGYSPNDSGGYLAQWSSTRLVGLTDLANKEHLPVTNLGVQLDYVWQELNNSYQSVLQNLKKATAIEDAVNQFMGPNNLAGQPVAVDDPSQRSGGYEDPGIPAGSNRVKYANDALNKYGHGVAGGSGFSACPQSGSPDCTSATGDTKILCEAKQFEGIYYEWSGGHQGVSAFKAGCPDPSHPPNNQPHGGPVNGDPSGASGNPSPCATDCSGLVSIATSEAFNQNYSWSVSESDGSMQGTGASNWKSVPVAKAQPGDIVTLPGHVEIVDHVSGGTVYTFGSHETGTKTGPATTPSSYWTDGAWHWTGPGSGG